MPNKRRMTQAQADRQHSRDRSGRYAEHYRCELCGRTTGDYRSDERCNDTGLGQILCEKCCRALAVVSIEVYVDALARSTALPAAARASLRDDTLAAEQKSRTGCVSLRLSRCGPVVGIYEATWGYTVCCESHHVAVEVSSLASAKSSAADPTNFCDECRGSMSRKPSHRRGMCPACWRMIAIIGNGVVARHHGAPKMRFVCVGSGSVWTERIGREAERAAAEDQDQRRVKE